MVVPEELGLPLLLQMAPPALPLVCGSMTASHWETQLEPCCQGHLHGRLSCFHPYSVREERRCEVERLERAESALSQPSCLWN